MGIESQMNKEEELDLLVIVTTIDCNEIYANILLKAIVLFLSTLGHQQ